jgi:hypothetical protein
MYYDVLLAALPVCLLFTEPGRYLEGWFAPGGRRPCWMASLVPPTLLALLLGLPYLCALLDPTNHYPPCDTFCLLALWAWSGWTWLHTPACGATESGGG